MRVFSLLQATNDASLGQHTGTAMQKGAEEKKTRIDLLVVDHAILLLAWSCPYGFSWLN
jgi:hypothetical protein